MLLRAEVEVGGKGVQEIEGSGYEKPSPLLKMVDLLIFLFLVVSQSPEQRKARTAVCGRSSALPATV